MFDWRSMVYKPSKKSPNPPSSLAEALAPLRQQFVLKKPLEQQYKQLNWHQRWYVAKYVEDLIGWNQDHIIRQVHRLTLALPVALSGQVRPTQASMSEFYVEEPEGLRRVVHLLRRVCTCSARVGECQHLVAAELASRAHRATPA